MQEATRKGWVSGWGILAWLGVLVMIASQGPSPRDEKFAFLFAGGVMVIAGMLGRLKP